METPLYCQCKKAFTHMPSTVNSNKNNSDMCQCTHMRSFDKSSTMTSSFRCKILSHARCRHRWLATTADHTTHDISNALACHSSIKHMTDSTATGIRWSESTLTNNLTFIFQALSHCRSNHTDQDINGYVYSKWFLGFSASQLVLPFLNQSYILLACAAPNVKQVRKK